MDAAQLLADVFPVGSALTRLELVELHEAEGGGLAMTVRLAVYERSGEDVAIRDIKEQQVYVLGPETREDPRLAAAIAGWALAVTYVFERADVGEADELDAWMPHDLVIVGPLLRLRRPRTAEDFCDAALAGKQRLGKFLKRNS